MTQFSQKLVAILNKSIEPGKVMNALAHMCIALGASLGAEAIDLIDFIDADGGVHPNISKAPFIILRANNNKIRELRKKTIEENIRFIDFIDTMTLGTWEDQIKRTKETFEDALTYFGIVLCGPWDRVSELTKKFSLWK